MELYNDISEIPKAETVSGLTVGKFEGIHLGHQRLFKRLSGYCSSNSLTSAVIAFRNDPRDVTGDSDHVEHMIYTLKDREKFILECGIERTIFIPFNQNMAEIPADSFIQDIVLDRMKAQYFVCGEDFRFGRGREGDAHSCVHICEANGCRTEIEPEFTYSGVKVSSSSICSLILNGDFQQASKYLGRKYHIEGTVHRGLGIGKMLGFPTLNIWYPDEVIVPEGIFAATAEIEGREYHAAVNSGKRPTIGKNGKNIVEVHLLTETVPDNVKHIKLYPVAKVRDEITFTNTDDLSDQIREDCRRIEQILTTTDRVASHG